MDDYNLAFEILAKTDKLELKYQDYISLIIMIFGALFALLLMFAMVQGLISSSGSGTEHTQIWRR